MQVSNIINFIRQNHFRALHIFLISISIFALAFAYIVEYMMHFAPCPLCIYQRFPYLSLIKISVTALFIQKISKYTLVFIVFTLLCACVLAAYHTGIENGIFEPSVICSSLIHIPEHLSIKDIREMFYSQPITSCTKAAFKIFKLSMTEWNLLLNLGLLFGVLFVWFYPKPLGDQVFEEKHR